MLNVQPQKSEYHAKRGWKCWLVNTKPKGVKKLPGSNPVGEKVYFATKAEAAEHCALVNAAQVLNGGVGDSQSGTVAEAIEQLTTSIQNRIFSGDLAYTTGKAYLNNTSCWLEYVGSLRCDEITYQHIQAVIDGDFADLAYKTQCDKAQQLSRVLELARKLGWIAPNAPNAAAREKGDGIGVAIYRRRHGKSEADARTDPVKEPFDPKVIGQLVKFVREEDDKLNAERVAIWKRKQDLHGKVGHNGLPQIQWRANATVLEFALQTGLRFSEQAALRWHDIEFDKHRIKVSVALRCAGKGGLKEVGQTKSYNSKRYVPITHQLKALLQDWKLKSQFSKDDDLVFPTSHGSHQYSSCNWRKRILHHACEWVAVPQLNWHDCRHFFASVCLANYGDNYAKIADLLGHDSTDFTRRVYGHWVEKEQADYEAEADALSNAVGY